MCVTSLSEAAYFLKMADINNNILIELLIITGVGLLLSQKCIKERRKQRQWVCPRIRKTDSKGAYTIISNPTITHKISETNSSFHVK